MRYIKLYGEKLLLKELKRTFNFFMKECNRKTGSKGYGLIRDKTIIDKNICSIASVGYGLAALVIGVKHKWINYKKAYSIAKITLDTFINNVEGVEGFYYHFVNINNGKREWDSEISIIDTSIFICGALTAGEFFGKEVKLKAEILYKKINWKWYLDKSCNQFYMCYTPENGFCGKWDMYAEQLMIYILSVASPTFCVDNSVYYDFVKPVGKYKDIDNIIYSYCGTLFTYQYSHAWIDFKNKIDIDGINWFENSVKATMANRQYCIDNHEKFKTFNKNSWGLTACLGKNGYVVNYGAKPCLEDIDKCNDGTVAISGAEGSIVFTPYESIKALENYYNNFPKLWGKYGFKNSYNLENKKGWYSKEYIGIDKGIALIMIENYLNNTIWNLFMKNKYVERGLKILSIEKI